MKKIILTFVLGFIQTFIYSQDIVVLDKYNNNVVIGKQLQILEDNKDSLTPEAALNSTHYKPSKNRVPNLGFTTGSFWIKFKISNQTNDSNYVIQINQSLLDKVDLFEFSESGKFIGSQISGEVIPISERKYKDQYFIFDLKIPLNNVHNYLLKVKSGEQILMPVQVSTVSNILERDRNRDILFGIYFGIILVMMAYNLFIYFTVRDKSYLYYVVYIFFVGFTQAVLEGYCFKFIWSDNFWISSRSVYFSSALVSIASIVFLKFFLHTKEFTSKIDKLANYLIALLLICIVVSAYKVNNVSHLLTQVGIGLVSIYIFTTSFIIYRQGYRPAKFFFIAWFLLVIGIFIFVLKDAGIIEANIYTTYTLQFGSAIEVVMLSLALADSINILKKEKEDSQAETLFMLQQNERLILEQNLVLEQKVLERTVELEETNEELNATLNNLKETQAQLVDAEKMASLGQLTAGIAHEINNPINFVGANVMPLKMDIEELLQLIKMYESVEINDVDLEQKLSTAKAFQQKIDLSYLTQEMVILLMGIEDGAKRTAEIVQGLKNFSRLDETDLKMANINEGIESTLVLLTYNVPFQSDVVKNLAPDMPLIYCLPGKLNQVFMNLFSNALYALQKVEREFRKELRITTSFDDEYVYVQVDDDGQGMTNETKNKIFEPFFTTKDVGEGTGLGMSIVYKIMETHQAKIDVESEFGVGTKIKLTLKRKLTI